MMHRILRRSKNSFTLLNILGLTTGLTCAFLIYLWVARERSVNDFPGVYQVMMNSTGPEGITTGNQTPGLLAETLAAEMPEIDRATAVVPTSMSDKKGILSAAETHLAVDGQYADEHFFQVFPYHLIEKSPGQGIVLSKVVAQSLFHDQGPYVGRTVTWVEKDTTTYTITGIFDTTGAPFDVVLPYAQFLAKNPKLRDWRNNEPSTYITLKKGADAEAFSRKIKNFLGPSAGTGVSGQDKTLFLQKVSDTWLYNHYENGNPDGGRIGYVRLFSLVAVGILLIACINFVNLSTIRSMQRAPEIATRKILGAGKRILILQSLGDATTLTVAALLLSLGATWCIAPALGLDVSAKLFAPATAIATITGLLAGLYPAIYLSGFKPIQTILKTSKTETAIRKGLVVFQFALSTLFILAVGIVYRQVRLIEHKNLGYDREHVVYIEFGRAVPEATLQRIKALPGVVNAAAFHHNITERDGGTTDLSWPGKDPNQQINFTDLDVGYDFIETMKIPLKQGRSYSSTYGNDATGIVFNESAIKIMGLQHPLGQVVHLWGQDRTIIGVVRDFHFQSLHENIKPCFFDLSTNAWASKVAVRITGNQVIDNLEALCKTENPGYPFEYRFLDDDYQKLYASELQVATLSRYFAGLCAFISCLGLFGLAAFTAQRRRREIGIRKVVGASAFRITSMLVRDFLMPVGLAAFLALPIAGWLMNRWLDGFAYRVTAGPGLYLGAAAVLLTINLGTVGVTSIRAARANPIKSLRQP